MPPKWSSGRACGAASTTQWTRSASLRSHALMDKMEEKKNAQKEPNDLQELCFSSTICIKNVQKKCKKRHQIIEIMLEWFPLKLEACKS